MTTTQQQKQRQTTVNLKAKPKKYGCPSIKTSLQVQNYITFQQPYTYITKIK